MLLKTIIPLILIIAVLALVAIDIYRTKHPRPKPLHKDAPDAWHTIRESTLDWYKGDKDNRAIFIILSEDSDKERSQMSLIQGDPEHLEQSLIEIFSESNEVAGMVCDAVDTYRLKRLDEKPNQEEL